MALSTIFLTAASVLAVFDVDKAVDKAGKPIEPNRMYHSADIR